MKKEIGKISKWMKKYLDNSGCKGYVVGLSGGIDSAVVLSLCCKAVGKENVIAMSMPCNSSKDSEEDAQALTDNLGMVLIINPIENIYNLTLKNFSFKRDIENFNLIQGNLKARLRMVQLFVLANKLNYLVAGTSNKSEQSIFYGTKFGDMACDISPISHIYKTDIYKMAALMPEIPENILKKDPSADLWPGQKDTDEIGMSYEKLDQILKALEEKNSKELDKFNIEDIEKVQNRIKKGSHKGKMPVEYKEK